MKLLTKTNRFYWLSSLLVFLVGGFTFFFLMQSVIRDEVKEILSFELEQKILELSQATTPVQEVKEVEFEISQIQNLNPENTYRDTTLFSEQENELIPYLQLTTYRTIHGKNYRLVLRESLIGSEDILLAVTISLVALFGLMFLTLWLINNFQSRKIWKDFNTNIDLLRHYNIASLQHIPVVKSDIDEFQDLNTAIRKMTEKIREDYMHLKEFTENASHEIQTPLSVIRSNLDQLIQGELNEDQHALITRINKATYRMSNTHRALLLLSKIENNQFKETARIDLFPLIQSRLDEFEEYILEKNLNVIFQLEQQSAIIQMNPMLADILVNNLLTNAIKHNIKGGFIDISYAGDQLKFENSGTANRTSTEKLFQRFSKDNPSTDSPGLGMSIIKVICELYDMDVHYTYENYRHTVMLIFNPSAQKK